MVSPIVSRDKVREAFDRALALDPDRETAIAVTAHLFALPPEAVEECVAEAADAT